MDQDPGQDKDKDGVGKDQDGDPQDGGGDGGGKEPEGKEGKDKEGKEAQPPAKRYRMTDAMKGIVWQLVVLSNECCRLENEKKWVFFFSFFFGLMCCWFGGLIVCCVFSALEGSVLQVSEQGLRKVLYQKVCVLGLWCGVG